MNIQEIFDKYLGKPVEAEDPSNLDQCFDWAFVYCDEMGIPRETIRHLNAYEIWTRPNDLTLQYFFYIPNTANGVPNLGDIIVFSQAVGIAGHVSVCQKADVNSIASTDQNWNGHKYVEYIQHPYDNVLGWLSPKQGRVIIQQSEVDQLRSDRDTNYNNWQACKTDLTTCQNTPIPPQVDPNGVLKQKLADIHTIASKFYFFYRSTFQKIADLSNG